ncbi:Por secretion system C-terminal sorting domain-containing protein, partial [Maribacter orientalis]
GQEFTQRYQTRSFELSAPGTYVTYRLEITKNKGFIEMTQLAEIKLLGCEPQTEVSNIALEAKTLNQLSLYPNPAEVETSLRFDNPIQVESIQVFDVTGRLVRTIKGGLIGNQGTSIDVQELPDGIYFVKVRNSDNGEEFQQQMLIRRQ